MKIRTDFVTNSSSSSFVCVAIFDKELRDLLQKLKNEARAFDPSVPHMFWENVEIFDNEYGCVEVTDKGEWLDYDEVFDTLCKFFSDVTDKEKDFVLEKLEESYCNETYRFMTFEGADDDFGDMDSFYGEPTAEIIKILESKKMEDYIMNENAVVKKTLSYDEMKAVLKKVSPDSYLDTETNLYGCGFAISDMYGEDDPQDCFEWFLGEFEASEIISMNYSSVHRNFDVELIPITKQYLLDFIAKDYISKVKHTNEYDRASNHTMLKAGDRVYVREAERYWEIFEVFNSSNQSLGHIDPAVSRKIQILYKYGYITFGDAIVKNVSAFTKKGTLKLRPELEIEFKLLLGEKGKIFNNNEIHN